MLSRCPVLNSPTGRATNDVPIGIELVRQTYEDEAAFRAATADEAAVGAFYRRGDRPLT